VDKGTLTFGGS